METLSNVLCMLKALTTLHEMHLYAEFSHNVLQENVPEDRKPLSYW